MKIKLTLVLAILLAITVPMLSNAKGKKGKKNLKFEADSLALVKLYEECNGINWLHTNNWLEGPLSSWFGVTVEKDRVVALELFNDPPTTKFGLTGQLPAEIWNLDMLKILNLSANLLSIEIPPEIENLKHLEVLDLSYSAGGVQGTIPREIANIKKLKVLKIAYGRITGLPGTFSELKKLEILDLSGNQANFDISSISDLRQLKELYLQKNRFEELGTLNNQHLEIAALSNNNFTFEDLIPNMTIDNITYSPQMAVGEKQVFNPEPGSELTIEFEIGGEGNIYHWFKDGESFQELGNGDLVFPAVSYDDAGVYFCEISNPQVPGLIIDSYPITIYQNKTSSFLALEAFYNSTNDEDGWINNENWLSEAPLEEWYGITFNQSIGKYALSISGNNLIGHLPDELGELKGFYMISITNEPDVEGELPESLGNITELKQLVIKNTLISGDIPASIFQLPELFNINLSCNFLNNLPTQFNYNGITLNVQDNNLTFEDVLPFINEEYTFIYAPQKTVDHLEYFAPITGSDLTLTANYSEQGIEYQWYFNDEPLENETENTFTIYNISEEHAGIYTYKISHPDVPGLIIESRPKYIEISGGIKAGLEALYNSTDGDNWLNNENWLSNKSIGEWYGISIEEFPYIINAEESPYRTLIKLDLSSNNLTGIIPHEISLLYHFVTINLGNNQIGGELPVEIDELNETSMLVLSNNQISGQLPENIGNLINLRHLDLGGNQFTGNIPESIGNLEHLQWCSLDNNLLSGELPEGLFELVNLISLGISNNQFSGTISSDIINLTELNNLDISTNHFTSIPELFPNNLKSLLIKGNHLGFEHILPIINKDWELFEYAPQRWVDQYEEFRITYGDTITLHASYHTDGVIYRWQQNEDFWFNLENSNTRDLEITEESRYRYFVTHPDVPNLELRSFVKTVIHYVFYDEPKVRNALEALYIATNGDEWLNNENWMTDAPLNEWYGVTLNEDGDGDIRMNLLLQENNLTGYLPSEIGDIAILENLDFFGNNITGSIPPEIGQLKELRNLCLMNNEMTGALPDELFSCDGLTGLDLTGNNFTGELSPLVGNLKQMVWFTIGMNNFTGELPSELYSLVKIKELHLLENRFTNEISENLYNMTDLWSLLIGNNNFSSIPDLSIFEELTDVNIAQNLLSFEHILPTLQKEYNNIQYSPQKTIVDEIEYYDFNNQPISLNANYNCPGCNYQWYWNAQIIAGATSGTYEANEPGSYYYIVTHPDVPGLSINSKPKFVDFNETEIREALSAFYYSTGGDNWINNTNWLSDAPITNWFGITLNNGFFSLSLWNNNLVGTLPDEIGDLDNFRIIRLMNNPGLTGEIPASIADCASLQHLVLQNNNIYGTIPQSIFEIGNIVKIGIIGTQISELPDMSGFTGNSALLTYNQLSFEDIVPNLNNEFLFQYVPQNTIVDEIENITINQGEITELTANYNYSGCTYQWYKDGNIIDDATGSTLSVSEAGNYHYEVSHPETPGLIIPSNTKTVSVITNKAAKISSIEQVKKIGIPDEKSLSVFPNPVKNTCNIEIKTGKDCQIQIDLYNSQGQKCGILFKGEILSGKSIIRQNMDNYPAGIYFIRTLIDDKTINKKIIKE